MTEQTSPPPGIGDFPRRVGHHTGHCPAGRPGLGGTDQGIESRSGKTAGAGEPEFEELVAAAIERWAGEGGHKGKPKGKGRKRGGQVGHEGQRRKLVPIEQVSQVCCAHLRRDFQKLVERGGPSALVGEPLRTLTEELLLLWARVRDGTLAQKSLILLTDLAHNLLADFHHAALTASPFEGFGPKRIVRDLLAIPGRLFFEGSQLKRIELLKSHPNAKDLLICLERYCSGD